MADWADCPNCDERVRGTWRQLGGDWDGPEAQRPFVVPRYSDGHFAECRGSFESGAAVAFGLMGMAMAIRARRPRPGPVCRGYTSGCMCSKCINIERVAARDRSATK